MGKPNKMNNKPQGGNPCMAELREKTSMLHRNANRLLHIGQICLQSLTVSSVSSSSKKRDNSYKSQLIFTSHCNVSNPGKCLVTTLFNYLQIPNLNA